MKGASLALRKLKHYLVHLKDGTILQVQSQFAKVRADKVLIFGATRENTLDQYVNGSYINATFNADEYKFFVVANEENNN